MTFRTISILVLLAALPALAATIQVPGDQPTIQAGIDAAELGDTVLVAAGTWTGDGNRDLDFGGKDISLIGSGVGSCIIEVGTDHNACHFHSGETRDALVQGFTIQNGYTYAGCTGIWIENSSPTLRELVFANLGQSSGGMGGSQGSAINCSWGSPLIEWVTVTHCDGPGMLFFSSGSIITDCLIQDCHGGEGSWAGGICFHGSAAVATRLTLLDNSKFSGDGGGMLILNEPSPALQDCVFEGNSCFDELFWDSSGGGLACEDASPTILGGRFVDNHSVFGGGLSCENSSPFVEEVVFDANGAYGGYGGGIYLDNSSPQLISLTLNASNNEAGEYPENGGPGHAIACENNSSPLVSYCILAFSTAGNGIYADATSSPTLECCDIYGNADGPFGGTVPDLIGMDGNFAADPRFCDAPTGDFQLWANSPCAPDNNDCGVLIGALPVGCGVAVKATSWSEVKALF